MNAGLDQISQIVQQNSASAQQAAAASQELLSQASMLKEMVEQFSLQEIQNPEPLYLNWPDDN